VTKKFSVETKFTAIDRVSEVMRKIGAGFDRTFGHMTRRLRSDLNAARKVTTSLFRMGQIGFQAGQKIFSSVMDATGALDKIAKVSRQVGITTDTYQELEFAASQSGVSMEEFNTSLESFGRTLGRLKAGQGALFNFLRKVSPNMLKAVEGAGTAEEALGVVLEGLARLEDPSKRAAFAMAAFGATGAKMGLLLGDGAEGLTKLREEAQALGIVVPESAFATAESFNDEVDKLGRVGQGAMRQIGAAVAEAALPQLLELTQWVKDNREGFQALLKDIGVGIVDAVGAMVKGLEWVVKNKDEIIGWAKVLGGVYLATMVLPALKTMVALLGTAGKLGKAAFAGVAATGAGSAAGSAVAGGAIGAGARALGAVAFPIGAAMAIHELSGGETIMDTIRGLQASGDLPRSQPSFVEEARARLGASMAQAGEAKIMVEFANAPAGMMTTATATGAEVEVRKGRRTMATGEGL